MGTNSYVTKLKAQLNQVIAQREHWKQLAENRNSIVVTEVCPESRSVEEYVIDADSVRASWRLIRGYREQIEALRAALLGIASVNPAERGIEWAKAYASDGLKGAGSELYARWLDTFKEAEALRAENARLRAELEQSDCALRESRANDTAAMGHLADMRQQRDKLAGLLERIANHHIDGNIRPTVRDCVNGRPDVQDIYGYCDEIAAEIESALSELTP